MDRTHVAAIAFFVGSALGAVIGRASVETTSEKSSEVVRIVEKPSTLRAKELAPTPSATTSSSASTTAPKSSSRPSHSEPVHEGHEPQDELAAALRDPRAMADALQRFREATDKEEIASVGAALGAAGGEAGEKLAVEILRGAGRTELDLARKAEALLVLAAQESPLGRAPALEALARESDLELRRAAAWALSSSKGATSEDAALVAPELARLLGRDADPELRRIAARGLVRWSGDLAPVLAALERDPDENVRASCAFALEDERVRSPAAIAALGRVIADPKSPELVREQAALALERLGPLDATSRAALSAYRARK